MPKREATVVVRYVLAVVVTAGFMIWQSSDNSLSGRESIDLALFWLLSVTAGWLQMGIIARGVRSAFDVRKLPGWSLLMMSALIGAVPLSFEIRWLVDSLVKPEGGLPAPWITYVNVSFINLNFSLLQYLLVERWPLSVVRSEVVSDGEKTVSTTGIKHTETMEPTVSLLRQKPERVEGLILYMNMEDHYLNVHTDQGHGLALCRMSDAEKDLANTSGLRVHRSWWVARSAVVEIQHQNRKRTIIATDGMQIPVGRSYEESLRAAGWL